MRLRSFLIQLVVIAMINAVTISQAQPVPGLLALHDALQDKNFYLLSLLESDASVRGVLANDGALRQISAERQGFMSQAVATCKGNADCMVQALIWTDEEIRTVSLALAQIYRENEAMRKLVGHALRPSGTYVLYKQSDGAALLANAWQQCARGINNILLVYGEKLAPRYPKIDSPAAGLTSADLVAHVGALLKETSAESSARLFFEPSLNAALQLLLLNHRDEASRMEPMESGVNAAAIAAMASIKWSNYEYSVIVVPGAGPGSPDIPLADAGRARAALAAEAYRSGKAPLILLSGGYVHPAQTRFAEAIEMKKLLLDGMQIPESALLVDPHARHTTTNMRNAAREIYRYHLPTNKPALVVSDAAQAGYIAGQPFAGRCLKELGYLPYQMINRPSPTSVAFLPRVESLQQDPLDPLDP